MQTSGGSPGEGEEAAPGSRVAACSILLALPLLVLAVTAKAVVVLGTLVGGGLLGHQLAGRPGIMVAVTAVTAVVAAVCYAAVTRTPDKAYLVHEVGAESMVWLIGGWLIVMGWLLGDSISRVGAVVGVLVAAAVLAVGGLVVASKLNDGLVATLRRRSSPG